MNRKSFSILNTMYNFSIDEFHIEGHVCPHCGVAHKISKDDIEIFLNSDSLYWNEAFATIKCDNPECKKTAVYMEKYKCMDTTEYTKDYNEIVQNMRIFKLVDSRLIYPLEEDKLLYDYRDDIRYVPERIMNDFIEAQKLIPISPNASIIFARKTLERIILEHWPNVIEAWHKEGELPSLASMITWLEGEKEYEDTETLVYLKDIGNCAVHIMNSQEEIRYSYEHAALALGVIDTLLHSLFIEPRKREERRNELKELASQSKLEKKSQINKTLSGSSS